MKKRLIPILMTLTTVFLTGGAIITWALMSAVEYQKMEEEAEFLRHLYEHIREDITVAELTLYRHVAGFEKEFGDDMDILADVEEDISGLMGSVTDEGEQTILGEILKKLVSYEGHVSAMLSAWDWLEKERHEGDAFETGEELASLFDEVNELNLERQEEISSRSHRVIVRSVYTILTVLSVSMLLITYIIYFMVKSLTKPVDALLMGVEGMSTGNFSHRVDIHSGDEIGKVASAINMMAERLEEREREISMMTEEIQSQNEELEEINVNLEEMVEDRTRELKEANGELEEKNLKLEEASRLKSEFLATMSHELRTPLNAIMGFSGVILQGVDGEINERQRESLIYINDSGRHLLDLINDILDLSRIEAGKMNLEPERLDTGEFVKSLEAMVAGLLKGKEVALRVDVADDVPAFAGDRVRMRQVMLNLLGNAAKFTEKGEIAVTAKAVREGNGDFIRISVSDTGIGIPEKDIPHIFEEFRQADGSSTRKYGGTGLGLAISRRIVEMHGGDLRVRSVKGEGSTFYFTIPVYEDKAAKTPGRDVSAKVAAEQTEGKGRVVMVVEDDPKAAELFRRYLKNEGYGVVVISDGMKVLDRAREIKPSAIALDIMIPNRDGWEVIQDLKRCEETRDIPVIIVTAKGLSENERLLLENRASVLEKRYLTREDLENRIREVVSQLPG